MTRSRPSAQAFARFDAWLGLSRRGLAWLGLASTRHLARLGSRLVLSGLPRSLSSFVSGLGLDLTTH